jgi:hypothetical protein
MERDGEACMIQRGYSVAPPTAYLFLDTDDAHPARTLSGMTSEEWRAMLTALSDGELRAVAGMAETIVDDRIRARRPPRSDIIRLPDPVPMPGCFCSDPDG